MANQMPNFGNGGSALSSLGGSMKSAGKSLQGRGGNARGGDGLSARQYRKRVGTLVDAHRAMSETETLHHGQRLDQSTDAAIRMREAGFANVSSETAHVKMAGTGKVKPVRGTKEDEEARAHNPSADLHGHPFAGHPFGNGTHPVIELPASAYRVSNPEPKSVPAVGSVRPTLALPAGNTSYEGQAGKRPGTSAPVEAKPFTATGKGEVYRPGQKVLNTKDASGPERTFAVGKRGTTRETTPGATSNSIAKVKPLKAAYDGPDAGATPRGNKKAWESKLAAQEAAHLASRRTKKDDN